MLDVAMGERTTPRDFMAQAGAGESFSFLKSIIDPEPTVQKLKHTLMGEEWDNKKEEWVRIVVGYNDDNTPIYSQPVLNHKGIQGVMIEVVRVSKDINLSNFTQEEINLTLRHFGIVLNDELYENLEEWGAEVKDFSKIHLLIFDLVASAYKRSLSEGERNLLKPSIEGGVKEIHDDKHQPSLRERIGLGGR